MPDGYLIDINDFDVEAFKEACCDEGFRPQLLKIAVPWMLNHPAIKGPHRCRGIVFGNTVSDDSRELRSLLGAELINVHPRRWTCTSTTSS